MLRQKGHRDDRPPLQQARANSPQNLLANFPKWHVTGHECKIIRDTPDDKTATSLMKTWNCLWLQLKSHTLMTYHQNSLVWKMLDSCCRLGNSTKSVWVATFRRISNSQRPKNVCLDATNKWLRQWKVQGKVAIHAKKLCTLLLSDSSKQTVCKVCKAFDNTLHSAQSLRLVSPGNRQFKAHTLCDNVTWWTSDHCLKKLQKRKGNGKHKPADLRKK